MGKLLSQESIFKRGKYLVSIFAVSAILFIVLIYYWSDKYFTAVDEYNITTEVVYHLDKSRFVELLYMRDRLDSEAEEMQASLAEIFTILESYAHLSAMQQTIPTFIKHLTNYRDEFSNYVEEQRLLKRLQQDLKLNSEVMASSIEDLKKKVLENASHQRTLAADSQQQLASLQSNAADIKEIATALERLGSYEQRFYRSQHRDDYRFMIAELNSFHQVLARYQQPEELYAGNIIEQLNNIYQKSLAQFVSYPNLQNLATDYSYASHTEFMAARAKMAGIIKDFQASQDRMIMDTRLELSESKQLSSHSFEWVKSIDILAMELDHIMHREREFLHPQPQQAIRPPVEHFFRQIDDLNIQINNAGKSAIDDQSLKGIQGLKEDLGQYEIAFSRLINAIEDTSIEAESVVSSALAADELLLQHKQRAKDTMDSVRDKVGVIAIFMWVFAIVFVLLAQVLRSAQNKMEVLADDLHKANIESERKRMTLVSLFKSIPDALSVRDIHGNFQDVNPTFEKLVGKSRSEIIGKTTNEIYSNDSEMLAQARKAGFELTEIEDTNRVELWTENNESKQKVLLDIVQTPLLDSNHEICGIIGLARDITDRHKVQETLRQSQREAEAASQLKSDFLANMSHEIRTPMNAIIGMSQLALATELTAKQRSYIEKLHFSADSLLGIINDILDFSKVESGKMELENIDFRLEEVLENFGNMIGFSAKKKALELNFDMPTKLPTALIGDPLRLGQVLTNLGNNAVKFTGSGGEVVIGISVQQETAQFVTLQFSVKDTGIGMSAEQQSKLFQSFSQADTSTTRKYGGTGLGLAISRSFVNLMGGDIWLESEVGSGTTFFFTVKLGKQLEQTDFRQEVIDKIGQLKVLFVDDNATSRAIYGQMLDSMHFNVSTEKCAATAISRVESTNDCKPYDLVMVDEDIPVINGGEVLAAIRDNPKITNKPATVLISTLGDRISEHDDAIGSALSKPATPSSMLEAILTALGKGAVTENKHEIRSQRFIQAKRQLRNASVLLVEDNLLNQEVACELLRNNGVMVSVAENGAEALAALETDNDFDGVLMDCQMPVMDGYAATRHIREMQQHKMLPIIAMTANAMVGDREKVLAAGMNDHIAKPIIIEDMFVTMAKWIRPQNQAEIPHGDSNPVVPIEPEKVPNITGIDCSLGLSYTLNNPKLYNKILQLFAKNNIDFEAKFTPKLKKADWVELERAAHTLKSTAGTIGAAQIQTLADQLEQACIEKSATAEGIFTELSASLQPIVTDLMQFFAKTEQANLAKCELDINKVKQCAQQLKDLLDDYDTEAVTIAEKLEKLLQSAPITADIGKVTAAINGYDFDSAQLEFNKLNDKLIKLYA